jgi:hypothetical protein
MDQIAWNILDASKPHPLPDGIQSSRPQNYVELWNAVQSYTPHPDEVEIPWSWSAFEHSWSNFLHHFFCHKHPKCFEFAPPGGFGRRHCALLAGAAEYLSNPYDLPLPAWLDDPGLVLSVEWDMVGEILPELAASTPRRRARTPEEFLNRRVVFEARNLITL